MVKNGLIVLMIAFMLLGVSSHLTAGDQSSEKAEKILIKDPVEKETNTSGFRRGIDPFSNLWLKRPDENSRGNTPVEDCPKGAVLKKLDLGQLNLIGIILTGSGNRALLQEASGRGHIITEGMCVGKTRSKAANILLDKIIFEEKKRDIGSGEISIHKKEMIIHKPY